MSGDGMGAGAQPSSEMDADPTPGEAAVMNIGQIRVKDEVVTHHGPEGADIFRVVNGRIMGHWDASPMEP